MHTENGSRYNMVSNDTIEFFNDQQRFDWAAVPDLPSGNTNDQYQWIMHRSGIPWLPLMIDIPYKEMLAEARALESLFVTHRNYGADLNQGWRSLCMHGLEWNKTLHFNNYDEYRHLGHDQEHLIPYKWCSEVADRCPVTKNFFENTFPYRKYTRIRFMWLDPGAVIEIHRDNNTPMLYPVNIALNNPDGCRFRMKSRGDVPFVDSGRACLVDVSNLHSVWNNSDTPRIHIIVHGVAGPGFQPLVVNSFRHSVTNNQQHHD
jgi:hypothetical protein